jgi:hypothetical protein
MSEFCRDRNPDAGAVERDCLGLERCDELVGSGSKDTSQEQFFLELCSMAASAQARRPHVVVFLCFWLLLCPYFFVKKRCLYWRRKFCSDAYNNLAIGLATFSVCQDVVLSCLDLTKQNVLSIPWECALAC